MQQVEHTKTMSLIERLPSQPMRKAHGLSMSWLNSRNLAVVQFYMDAIKDNAEVAVRNLLRGIGLRTKVEALRFSDFVDNATKIQLEVRINSETGSADFDFMGTPASSAQCGHPHESRLSGPDKRHHPQWRLAQRVGRRGGLRWESHRLAADHGRHSGGVQRVRGLSRVLQYHLLRHAQPGLAGPMRPGLWGWRDNMWRRWRWSIEAPHLGRAGPRHRPGGL